MLDVSYVQEAQTLTKANIERIVLYCTIRCEQKVAGRKVQKQNFKETVKKNEQK